MVNGENVPINADVVQRTLSAELIIVSVDCLIPRLLFALRIIYVPMFAMSENGNGKGNPENARTVNKFVKEYIESFPTEGGLFTKLVCLPCTFLV